MSPADTLIKRLLNMFGAPECPDPQSYIKEVRRSIDKVAPDILEEAGNRILDTCQYFPRPALIHEVIGKIIAERNIGKPKNLLPPEPELPPISPEAAERAARLVKEATEVMLKRGREAMGIKDEPLPDVSREAFEQRQRNSSITYLHLNPRTLTDLSRRMSGETSE